MDNISLIELREQQHDLYVKIAHARGEVLEDLLEQVEEVDACIDAIENPLPPALTKSEFVEQYHIETRYQTFHDEYGDAAAPYWEYTEYHYNDYLDCHKNRQDYSF